MGLYDADVLEFSIGDTLELSNGKVIEVVPDDGYPCRDKCVLGGHNVVRLKDGSFLRCAHFNCHTGFDEIGIHFEVKEGGEGCK